MVGRAGQDRADEAERMTENVNNPEQQYQPDRDGMYELEFPAPQLSSDDGRGPVLVHALEGFSDAGHAIKLAATHLKNTLDTELVASFAIDDLLDYRSRRPLMTFHTDHFTGYDDPELNLYALHDSVGTPFLLLAGLDLRQDAEHVLDVVADLVGDHIGLGEVAGGGEAGFHLAEEAQVEIHLLVAGTIEGADGGIGEAAGRAHAAAEEHAQRPGVDHEGDRREDRGHVLVVDRQHDGGAAARRDRDVDP